MPQALTAPNIKGPQFQGDAHWVKLAIAGTADHSAVFASLANPFGKRVIIVEAILDVPTVSAGACTVDIGVAADATTSADNLIDGYSTATAGAFGGAVDGGTNGKNVKSWASSEFVNVKDASGDPTALRATLYLLVIVPE